jgi:hypothetical protein
MRAKMKRPRLIDDSAFLLQREKPYVAKPDAWFRSKDHRDWLNTLPCHICGVPAAIAKVNSYHIDAAHVRKGTDGCGSEKPSDYFCWPGCSRCHRGEQHQVGEPAFFARYSIPDPIKMALGYALRSICAKTRAAGAIEFERRYGRAS